MTSLRTWRPLLACLASACGEIVPSIPIPKTNLLAVSAINDHDAWAVGEAGTVLHFDGSDWLQVATNTTSTLRGVWSGSADDVWAVGDASTTIHWDGVEWTGVALPEPVSDLRGMWGVNENDVWTVTNHGVFHWDGSTWSFIPLADGALDAIFGTSPTDIWAVGIDYSIPKAPLRPGAFHFDGFQWTEDAGFSANYRPLVAVWGSDPGHYWAGGSDELDAWDGTSWSMLDPSTHPKITSIWGLDANAMWAIGVDASIWFWDGTSFSSVYTAAGALHGIHGTSRNDVWAVGDGGLIVHWDGFTWTPFAQ